MVGYLVQQCNELCFETCEVGEEDGNKLDSGKNDFGVS